MTSNLPDVVGVYSLLVILGGAFASLAVARRDHVEPAPVRAGEPVALFLIRTVILVPCLAGLTALLRWAGVL